MLSMRNYDVYFELYGKKLKKRVLAKSEADAKKQIANDIVFHKTVKANEEFNEVVDIIDNIIDTFKQSKNV